MNPPNGASHIPLRILGTLESDHRGECFVGNMDLSEMILSHFAQGEDLDITITQRRSEGWGE
jgi:hypothetical protein